MLHLNLGCSHGEIAEALALVSAEAVRKRIARALMKLQRLMQAPILP
jgi:DNA-directed RNA polymerase specialized sigma24 family protein